MPSAPAFELLPDAYSVVHDHELTASAIEEVWGVLHNDTNAVSVSAVNGDVNALGEAITLASGATLTMYADGGFFYVPLAGAAYVDQFSYSATDGSESASALLTISITNAVPTVYDTTLSTPHDRDLRIYPEEFAWDDDFDTLTMTIVSQAAVGSVVDNGDGTITFAPPEHWAGTTSLIVHISDGIPTSNDVVLTINVTNNAPVATADVHYLHAGLILSLDATDGLMHNDYDSDWDHLVAEFVGEWPDDGVLTFSSNGAISFEPDEGFIGDVNLEYRLFDGVTYSDTVALIFHVENETPQGTPEEFDVWYEHGITGNVLENDWDEDHDELSVLLVSGPAYAESFELLPDGNFSYLIEPLTFVLQDTFTYKLFDGTSYSEPIAVTLHFTNSPLAKDDAYVLDETGALTVSFDKRVLVNDYNPMNWELTAALVEPLDPNIGSVAFNPNGTFTFTAAENWEGITSLRYSVNENSSVSGEVFIATQQRVRDSIGLYYVGFKSNANILNDGQHTSGTPTPNGPDFARDAQGIGFDDSVNYLHWLDLNSNGAIDGASYGNAPTDYRGDHQYPASFTRNTKISLMVGFKIADPLMADFWRNNEYVVVKATGPAGLTFGAAGTVPLGVLRQTITGYGHIYILGTGPVLRGRESIPQFNASIDGWVEMDNSLRDETNYFSSFQLDWQVFDGNGWFAPPAHTSTNEVFVTLAPPNGSAANAYQLPDARKPAILHTLLYAGIWGSVGSTNADLNSPAINPDGKVNATNLIRNVFAGFQSRTIARADGLPMTYYGSWIMNIPREEGFGSHSLIRTRDGTCDSWARFFIDVLRAQGGNFSYEDNAKAITSRNMNLAPNGFSASND